MRNFVEIKYIHILIYSADFVKHITETIYCSSLSRTNKLLDSATAVYPELVEGLEE